MDFTPARDSTRAVEIGEQRLEGLLTIPDHAGGLVIFAHGSGSSRLSPRNRRVADVEEVLDDIGAGDVPRIEVFNKIDRLGREPGIERDSRGRPERVWVSAQNGAGMELLLEAVAEALSGEQVHGWLHVGPAQGRLRARLFAEGAVLLEEAQSDGSLWVELALDRRDWERIAAAESMSPDVLHGSVARVAGAGSGQ